LDDSLKRICVLFSKIKIKEFDLFN